MKKVLIMVLCLCVLSLGGLSLTSCGNDEGKTKIGIVQIVEHPSLDLIRDSIIEKLNELGYTDENSVIYKKSAAGDPNIATQIISEFKSNNCDIIIPIATPTAQAAMNIASEIPVVFAAVSDPIGAGLTTSIETPDKGITGTSDEIQVDQIVDLAIKIDPSLAKLGVIYNPSEANSVSNINNIKAYCETLNIEIIEAAITSATDIATNITSLAGNVDAIFTPNDNTVATDAGMNILSKFCNENKIPLYVGADSMVSSGGFATVGINYVDLGHETAIMADKILKGEAISNIPVKVFNDDLKIYINETVLETLGIELPDAVSGDPLLELI